MAKYRCPICGAAHKEPPTHCRLCGQDMRDAAFVPMTPKGARVATKQRKGTLRIGVLGALAVLAILVLALVLGFRGDDTEIIDEVVQVQDEDAFETSRRLAKLEGFMCGISCGAAAWAALELARRRQNRDKLIVVVLPDLGERYLSTRLFPE